VKSFVFVVGFDFVALAKRARPTDYSVYAASRMRTLVRQAKAKDELRFIVCNVAKGTLETTVSSVKSGRRVQAVTTRRPFKAITSAMYRSDAHFRTGNVSGTWTAPDVYHQVQELGRQHPGSLRELSVFSHAWFGGPILVNSDEPPGHTSQSRHVHDVDMRAKDFENANMDKVTKARFRSAWAPGGHSWIWGCTAFPNARAFLQAVHSHPKFPFVGLSDADPIEFSEKVTKQARDGARALLHPVTVPRFGAFTVTRADLESGLCRTVVGAYGAALARGSDRPVFAALPGSTALLRGGSKATMFIPPAYRRTVDVYRKVLGIRTDPEGGLYGRLEPSLTC
jgi:hypothetical protein